MRLLQTLALVLLAAVLCVPVLSVLASWAQWDAGTANILSEMAATVLPEYALTTVILCVGVALGVVGVGTVTAMAVTLVDFPGRRQFEWLLLLPMAMPAYVVAYAYTDFFQFSGPFQTWLRASFGLQGRLLPEIRSTGGATLIFIVVLYPYVYLLARAALSERAAHLMEAARLMGAPLSRRLRQVALPMIRPALVAGLALALMEVLADYGVVTYFGIQTFTAGIYKAWLSMDNRVAAAQLATMLLASVVLVLSLERHARRRQRFASVRGRAGSNEAQALPLSGSGVVLAWAVCGVPILLGFVLPVAFQLRALYAADWEMLPWTRYLAWGWNSVYLAGLTAALAVLLALGLAYVQRTRRDWASRGVVGLVSLGYAVPGAVVLVGLLLPVGWVQGRWPDAQLGYWITATVLGLIWAYLVRFTAVAMQSVHSGYTRIAPSLDESARMLGASGPRLLARVHWPLLKRSTAAAGLLVFVDVMKELPVTVVLRPFNTDTLAVIANQLARDERLGEAAVPALALVAVGLIPVMLLSRALRAKSG
ncbi:ABC transporter permease [Comamonas serinivorans]|uniref:ABC transporter permease n=1 Tax=Comamonas serinivorans TaxID=1082851 RepID=UPI001F3E50C8|nr:iron ABC transporter permease [Comamonas serinivorans]